MNPTSIAIPNDKAAAYRVVTLFILLSNLLAFGYAVLYAISSAVVIFLYVGFVTSLLSLVVFIMRAYYPGFKKTRVEITFIICAMAWIFSGNHLLGILLFVFAMAGLVANRKYLIHFTEQHICYPSFPEKIFLWSEVDFVMLKDDILTIEMKDNRLMQFTIDKEEAAEINAEEFNHVCKERAGREA